MARKPWSDRGSRHERGYGWRWVQMREQIMRRDSYLCQPCMTKGHVTPATEVHHIKAKADGGTDDPGNLVAICRGCHDDATREQKGHRPRVAFDDSGRVVW